MEDLKIIFKGLTILISAIFLIVIIKLIFSDEIKPIALQRCFVIFIISLIGTIGTHLKDK